ncbi:MAG: SagB/ThcOx family dehydrogenase [Cyanobacteria bacterium P01_A01_bin.105]
MTQAPVSIAQYYHQRTKYDPETIAQTGKALDWSQQPVPYKTYPLGAEIDLKPFLKGEATSGEAASGGGPGQLTPEEDTWWRRLSHFLVSSYGLTAKVMTPGEPVYLRASPSAGGLYPAEVYLISRGTSLVPAGLYNYQARSHSLLRFWEDYPWPALQAACFWHPALENIQLALVVTGVFQRSVWRYQARAYRRILLDSGHLLGNLVLAGSLCDYRPHLIGGFIDEAVNRLLYLEEGEEGAIAVLALADLLEVSQNLSLGCTALPTETHVDYPHLDGDDLLPYLHQVSQIAPSPDLSLSQGQPARPSAQPPEPSPEPFPEPSPAEPDVQPEGPPEVTSPPSDKYALPFGEKRTTTTPPISWGEGLSHLNSTILRRRSTRHYTGADLPLTALLQVLDFTYQPTHYREQGLDANPDYFDLSLIETFVAVSGVTDLEPGCYYYAPQAQTLRQVRFKQFRRELHYLCLGQNLGRDAAAIVFHTADLSKAIERYGDRAYRYLHLDAGHLGQRLNLAAIGLQLGVSGIAGFFDDQVNDVLGIPEDEAVLYITTLGMPRS